jgi:hypothetical protein
VKGGRAAARVGLYRIAALLVLGALVCDAVSRRAFADGSVCSIAARVASIGFFVAAMVPFVLALRERQEADRDGPA